MDFMCRQLWVSNVKVLAGPSMPNTSERLKFLIARRRTDRILMVFGGIAVAWGLHDLKEA